MENYAKIEQIRKQHIGDLKREKILKQRGLKVNSNAYVPRTNTKIYVSVSSIKRNTK
jgi:hypothetical protein